MRMFTALLLVLSAMAGGDAALNGPQATVTDTGSTNRTGIRVTFDEHGTAVATPGSQGEATAGKEIKIDRSVCKRLLDRLKEVGSVGDLPVRHCMKSASFGSRLYIEFKGQRSPDLSCPGQNDSAVADLQELAQKVVESARSAANIPSERRFER